MPATTLESYRVEQLEGGRRPGYYGIFNSSYLADTQAALTDWHSKRILLVFSKTLNANTSVISDIRKQLGALIISQKEGVGSHSPYRDVIDIAHKIQQDSIDCIISIGSGSYSDACKAARLLQPVLAPGFSASDIEALIDQSTGTVCAPTLKKPSVKLIVVPTSLSAGEWNHAASATNERGKKQHFVLEDGGAPDLVLMDPRVASTAPRELWLASGMRAVDHCVELLCHCDIQGHADAQGWCEDALRGLVGGLVEYKEGREKGEEEELLEGIARCQAGSRMALMSLMIYGLPMGASHAIGHQVGSVAGVMHGVTSCVMLPHVLRFTKEKSVAAQAVVLKVFNETLEWHEAEAGDAVARLVRFLGLPGRLSEVGVTEDEQIDLIIEHSMTDAWGMKGRQMERNEIAEIVNAAR